MQDERVLCWNYRGARSKEFPREMRDWVRIHRPSLIILLEPRISGSGADKVCKKLGKSHWIISKEDGFSGGIWLLWDEASFLVSLIHVHK